MIKDKLHLQSNTIKLVEDGFELLLETTKKRKLLIKLKKQHIKLEYGD